MRHALAIVVLLAVVSAPTVFSAGSASDTRLTVTYFRDGGNRATRARWILTCSPTDGTHPRPAAACAVLGRLGRSVFAPVPPETACTEIYGGPQVAIVSGLVAGRKVWARFRRDDGCQLKRWERAGALLPRTTGVS
jgi:hypothetical protein